MLKHRVRVLGDTVILLSLLMSEIEYSKKDIVKILSSLSESRSLASLPYLKVFNQTESSVDFHGVWADGVSSFSYYKREEKEKMLQLGSFLGTTDAENQLSAIKLYLGFFDKFKMDAIGDYEKYGKVSSLFGIFIGASLFILVL